MRKVGPKRVLGDLKKINLRNKQLVSKALSITEVEGVLNKTCRKRKQPLFITDSSDDEISSKVLRTRTVSGEYKTSNVNIPAHNRGNDTPPNRSKMYPASSKFLTTFKSEITLDRSINVDISESDGGSETANSRSGVIRPTRSDTEELHSNAHSNPRAKNTPTTKSPKPDNQQGHNSTLNNLLLETVHTLRRHKQETDDLIIKIKLFCEEEMGVKFAPKEIFNVQAITSDISCSESESDRPTLQKILHNDSDPFRLTVTKPRSYQIELYRKALREDTVVFLPTGCGKTLVSAMVIGEMLRVNPRRPVVFIVDKILLVLQQAEVLKEELRKHKLLRYDTNWQEMYRYPRVSALTGETPLQGQIREYDIIVSTAAYYLNLLNGRMISHNDISLLIIDEVHHCVKEHPFRIILRQHNKLEYDDRPKLLGLTASPAGKKSTSDTRAMVNQLMTSLGSDVTLSIVEEHREELRRHQTIAELQVIHVNGRDLEDTGKRVLSTLKRKILEIDFSHSQGINRPIVLVLVKTRDRVSDLYEHLDCVSEFNERDINVSYIFGHGKTSGSVSGMTAKQQKRRLQEIQSHEYQVVVATSVAEEGIDLPQCELVVLLEPPKDVTSMIQTRGRARKGGSRYIAICSSFEEVAFIEELKERERSMIKACENIAQDSNKRQNQGSCVTYNPANVLFGDL